MLLFEHEALQWRHYLWWKEESIVEMDDEFGGAMFGWRENDGK